jgi:hypothetical protein
VSAFDYHSKFNEVCFPPSIYENWNDWVGASKTRNYVLNDPILDWLDLYGMSRGYVRDDESSTYDPRTDFAQFIFSQGDRFETAVVSHLGAKVEIIRVAATPVELGSVETATTTLHLMKEGIPVIHQGVVFDPTTKTYGAPDLLVRSDVLAGLFPCTLRIDEAKLGAPNIGAKDWHYRVLDIKFTTLKLTSNGELSDSESNPAHKVQLYIYNRALGWTQGITPNETYLLGRGWTQSKERGSNCMERLAVVTHSGRTRKTATGELTDRACNWIRQVREHGATWSIIPEPSKPELYPNMSNQLDGPWHQAKKSIANELSELTLLWQVGVDKRRRAHEAGLRRWNDTNCSAEELGVTGATYGPMLQRMIEVNQASNGGPIEPAQVRAGGDDWRATDGIEFYVDFETVSDLADDFSKIPDRGGQPLIFMIGCGHLKDGKWNFSCFIAESLDEKSEAQIIDDWLEHMRLVKVRLDSKMLPPKVFHWSPAEPTSIESAYNSANNRHSHRWPRDLEWFDFLKKVVMGEPVVVRGAMGFGLKEFGNALYSHGLIDTCWESSSLDGLGAMVGAWRCYEEAISNYKSVREIDLMSEIERYNEIDCKVMMEIITYLRQHH